MQRTSLSNFLWFVISDNTTREVRYEFIKIPDHCTVNSVFTLNARSMRFEDFRRKYWYFSNFRPVFVPNITIMLTICFGSIFIASEPDRQSYYLDGINQKQLELAKKFKPRDRRGRKAKVTNFEDPPEVGNEVELLAV